MLLTNTMNPVPSNNMTVISQSTMTQSDHENLCVYLNEWLHTFEHIRPPQTSPAYPKWQQTKPYAHLVNDTLTELLLMDVEEAGL